MEYQGSCHCGKLKFQVRGDLKQVLACNSSICSRSFCPKCGIHSFAYGVDPKGNKMAAINVRCLEGVDLDKLPAQRFDGRSL